MASICMEEYDLLGDAKYRSYVSAVDKALKNFEYTSEWADLISALAKLNKVLSSHMRYPVIPKRLTISKRLAQCMHHALPAGVHLKAIETYDIIFKCIGTNRLSQELFIYSAGLFPLLGHAAMIVKPALLTIYETHFVPLRERLRPGLHGFLVGVLPALEENSENFQRTSELLEQICEGTDPNFFYGALWDCVISNPGVRLTAVDFALNHFNRKLSMEDQLYMIGTDIDTMVRAFCLAVQDNNILVQRSTLDLLQLCFPMHNSQLLKPDMSKIVTSSILVILRRDMSLNRRLFGWLLGFDSHPPVLQQQQSVSSVTSDKSISENEIDPSSASTSYFKTYSRDLVINAMINCLKGELIASENHNMPDLWCYRLLQSMLDKPDIAGSVLDEILIQVFRSLYNDCNSTTKVADSRSSKHSSELLKAANVFFSTLEPDYIWSYISAKFRMAAEEASKEHAELQQQNAAARQSNLKVLPVGSQSHTLSELCLIVSFLLDVLTLETYMDTPSNYLPEFLRVVCKVLTENMVAITPQELTVSLSLCSKILSKIQPNIEAEFNLTAQESECNVDAMTESDQDDLERNIGWDEELIVNPIIQKCVSSFQDFFLAFFRIHIFSDDLKAVVDRSSDISKTADCTYEDQQKLLETLLWKCLGVNLTINGPTKPFDYQTVPKSCKPLNTKSNLDELSEPYGYACQLLLELSSFPVYCNRAATKQTSYPASPTSAKMQLPDWLNLLLLGCCFVENSDFHFISSATILDLISITKGAMQDSNKSKRDESKSEDKELVISVKIAPVLTVDQLLFIEKETTFYNIAATRLWNYLGSFTSEHHLKAVQLLVLLQNLSAEMSICEDLLGMAMTQQDDQAQVESMNKFSVLWHSTRDLKPKLGTTHNTYFDRSLFVMLDNLEKPVGPQKAVAQTWLTHCIQMNDLSRILEPIHLMLLHSDSARVSIQHVHINRPKKVKVSTKSSDSNSNDEAKIYAISSIEGNVIYHVGSEDSKPLSRIGSPERRILALTSILNPSDGNAHKGSTKVITADSMIQDYELPSLHEQQLAEAPMSLYMNPFGSLLSVASDSGLESGSTQADLSNAKVVDISAAIRKSSFDLDEQDGDSESNCTQTPDSNCPEMSSVEIVTSILDEILSAVTKDDSVMLTAEFSESEEAVLTLDNQQTNENEASKPNDQKDVAIHPLHTHLLLYYQVYDAEKTLYALSILKTILSSNPRAVLCAMTTTSICNVQSSRYVQLLSLLVRHKKSVFGKNFHGELFQSDMSSYRSSMYIEVIILICIYYIRGYYPNNINQMRLSVNDIIGNRNVQLMSSEVLTIVFSELLSIVKDSSKSLASYIAEIMTKCKLQKTVLHCLIASVYNASRRRHRSDNSTSYFTDAIVDFNESLGQNDASSDDNDFNDTLQTQLLRLLLVVIILEDEVFVQKRASDAASTKGMNDTAQNSRSSRINFVPASTSNKYQPNVPIPGQSMFLNAVLNALKQHHSSSLLTHWMNLVTLSLPYMGKSLSSIVSSVVNQICINLESKAEMYCEPGHYSSVPNLKNPPDYMIVLLDGLTSLCHYCILDNSSQVSTVNPPMAISPSPVSVVHPTQIFSNLIHVFTNSDARKASLNKETPQQVDPIITARKSLLSSLPRIISALASLWNCMKKAEAMAADSQKLSCWIMGNPKAIRQQILSFVSPISLNHGTSFFGAVALIWPDPKSRSLTSSTWSEKQRLLIDLISNIKVMPIDTLVQNVRQVMKQPPPTSLDLKKKNLPLEVSILQFFLAYVNLTPGAQLAESWSSLIPLWRDGIQLTCPPVQFLLLGILNEYVLKTTISEDKKEQRELQEIAQKLIEICSDIAGSSLEQTTWLRRNLAVKSVPQYNSHEFDDADASSMPIDENLPACEGVASKASQYSVQALIVLAQYVAPLLDVVYVSEEKDKIVPLLSNIMHYVTPYLKNHSKNNIPSFRACSQLLKSLSGYQYSRKAWKKEVFDLLMDPTFFHLDHVSLTYWRPVVDHLMTHDKLTFRDLMARVSISPSTLNLFTSKDQEYELRAQLLKRLAFVIFCSEMDQYQRYIPDIQERLSECLRLQIPLVQSQVFLCFRVLLIRLSCYHVTSLWPVIITELVQIFLQMEQELSVDTEEFRSQNSSHLKRLSMMDSSWVISNGLNAHNSPVWLQLYLSACKLLDLALTLPAEMLPQFQIYRWAFVGESLSGISNNNMKMTAKSPSKPDFVPHITRLAKLMDRKMKCKTRLQHTPGQPMLDMRSIKTLCELHPFFLTLSELSKSSTAASEFRRSSTSSEKITPNSIAESGASSSCENLSNSQVIEKLLEKDFLE